MPDLNRALPLLEQTVTDRTRVLGPDHPHTLISRNNLVTARYESTDDLSSARDAYQLLLGDAERALGAEQAITATIRRNLEQTAQASAPQSTE